MQKTSKPPQATHPSNVLGPIFGSRMIRGSIGALQFKVRQLQHLLRRKSRAAWKDRIDLVVSCPDNAAIKRVSEAGEARGGVITMHNGVRILLGSYYGPPMAELLVRNKGVHEPQEEIAFDEVLKVMKPGASMIELGAYWGYYSLSFTQAVQDARCILVEPSANNLRYGQDNFALNGYQAEFVHGGIGSNAELLKLNAPPTSVDQLCAEHGLDDLDMLHADIQGAEVEMLAGAEKMLSTHSIGFVFVSTHREDLHSAVKRQLANHGYRVFVDIPLNQSYSVDGIVAASSPSIAYALPFEISRRGA